MNTTESIMETTVAAEIKKNYKQIYFDIEWWMNSISFIVLPVVGGFGNILTFIVMQRGSLKEVSTCFYMSILVMADTGKYNTKGCLNTGTQVQTGKLY